MLYSYVYIYQYTIPYIRYGGMNKIYIAGNAPCFGTSLRRFGFTITDLQVQVVHPRGRLEPRRASMLRLQKSSSFRGSGSQLDKLVSPKQDRAGRKWKAARVHAQTIVPMQELAADAHIRLEGQTAAETAVTEVASPSMLAAVPYWAQGNHDLYTHDVCAARTPPSPI